MSVRIEGEVVLPTNPNCVSFSAEAADVLVDRTWADVLDSAARVLQLFWRSSRLPALVCLSVRGTLDRRNRTHTEFSCAFVFDGPATREDLQVLEREFQRDRVRWSEASIERIPQDCIQALLVHDGHLFQLWTELDDGSVRAFRYEWEDGRPRVVRMAPETTNADRFLPNAKHAIGVPARLADHDYDVERMRLAFAHHFAQKIVEADGIIQPDETRFMEQVFPDVLLDRLGIAGAEARALWRDRSFEVLPKILGHHDKLALVGLFFSVCYSDSSLDAREMKVLKDASEILGIDRNEVVNYLRRFW